MTLWRKLLPHKQAWTGGRPETWPCGKPKVIQIEPYDFLTPEDRNWLKILKVRW